MGAVQLTAAVAFVCLLLPDTAAQNLIKNPREQKTEHSLLINEINADNPGLDTWEFLELYHTSGHQAALDGYYLVFYNGNGNQAYKVLNLQGHVTNSQGFFLVGSHTVNPLPSLTLRPNTIQNGPDAIALYYGNGRYFEGIKVTNNGLVDALVHKSKKADKADTLLSVLTPDQDAFLEDPLFRSTDESLERCRGSDLQWFFQVAMPTPGRDNHCIPSSQLNASTVLISEISTVSTSEGLEFIELQGPPSTTLGDLVLVLIEGGAKEVYFFMDVYGKTSPDGVLLIGPAQSKTPVDLQFPQNASSPLFRAGPNAVALYLGNSSSFSLGTAASATNLLDALVYTSNRSTAPELLEILTPGRPIFYEDERHQQGDVSVSRCSCCSVTRDASAYALSSPTPGQFNDCPSKRFSQAISFCLHGAGECHVVLLYIFSNLKIPP
uniref:LTD domain-containing protein n=1 Tax=Sphenodon punctatus TaxID=8508 RepID=A0A8D0HN30_SPHPU